MSVSSNSVLFITVFLWSITLFAHNKVLTKYTWNNKEMMDWMNTASAVEPLTSAWHMHGKMLYHKSAYRISLKLYQGIGLQNNDWISKNSKGIEKNIGWITRYHKIKVSRAINIYHHLEIWILGSVPIKHTYMYLL